MMQLRKSLIGLAMRQKWKKSYKNLKKVGKKSLLINKSLKKGVI